ncbi:hypothetical protein SprV_0902737300 [Sparganum proliferum]
MPRVGRVTSGWLFLPAVKVTTVGGAATRLPVLSAPSGLTGALYAAPDKLRKAGALKRNEALAAKATDAAMARFYGLPKVHKPGVPLRPIVSLRGTPTFGLSKWLYQRFRFLTEGSEWTVKSAEEFLKSIRNLEMESDEMMVSFDVVSLFTSIPTGLAISTIDGLLQEKYDDVDQQLKRTHITELLELCLRTFFTFGDRVYEQKKGTPMGSPLSGLIAEAVLQRLERLVFRSYSPKFWARYVDDTFVVIKRNDVQGFKVLLNSIFPDIQFTMEEENNNQLPFLDVNVARTESDEIMVSFDVVSLFTFIPLELAKQCTEDLLQSCDTDVPAIALLELLDLCMETNFSFDQQYYQQLKGAPMGSPISGFLAEITMQKLEAKTLPLVNPKL